jgi:cell division protease FtsH
MVCDFGMSDLGPIAMGENQDTVFLGRDITRSQHISEDTARRVDVAVAEIISTEYKRAEQILGEHRAALDKIAAALLEHETIEGRHVLEILKDGEIKSPIVMVKLPPRQPPEAGKPAGQAAPTAPSGAPAPSPA